MRTRITPNTDTFYVAIAEEIKLQGKSNFLTYHNIFHIYRTNIGYERE